jgi:acyl dehydratase
MQGPTHTTTFEALAARVGQEIGVSAWTRIDQPMIDAFAKLTGDQHFIHVDPVRAAAVMPSKGTIAHGFLTLSLLSNMAYQVCPTIEGVRFPLNYGFNRLRFVAPVPVGSRVRAHFVLHKVEAIDAVQRQLIYNVTVEIEGRDKPALAAEWLTRITL